MKLVWAAFVLLLVIGFIYALNAGIGNDPAPISEPPTQNEPINTRPELERVKARFGETVSALGVTITPHMIIEDSRCAVDVVCIQAGTVKIHAELTSGLGTGFQIFELNQPITTETEEITLVEVEPEPFSQRKINEADYVFHFVIQKR
jgi:hypothetical protein